MKKIYKCAMTAVLSLFSLASLAQEAFQPFYKVLEEVPVPLYAVSANGRFATGEFEGMVAIYDVDKEEVSTFYDQGNSGTMLKCVSDEGIAGGEFGVDMDGAAALYVNEEWSILPVPKGFLKKGGVVNGISRDASVLAGYVSDGFTYQACVWTKEGDSYRPELLPVPDKDIWGTEPLSVMCNGMSGDGSIIYGRLNDFTGFYYFPIIWQKKDGAYTYEVLGQDLLVNDGVENPGPQPQYEDYVTAKQGDPDYEQQCNDFAINILGAWWEKVEAYISSEKVMVGNSLMSNNGKYLVFNIGNQPYKIDITNECKITPFETSDALACAVADDGTTVLGTPATFSARTALIAPGETLEPVVMTDWLKENYGLEIPKNELYSDIGTPAISADGKTIVSYFMMNQVTGGSIVIRLAAPDAVYSLEKENESIVVKDNRLCLAFGEGKVAITDLTGKNVYTRNVTAGITDLSFLPAGLYVIKVEANGERYIRKMFVGK